jgi:hypothetical protein
LARSKLLTLWNVLYWLKKKKQTLFTKLNFNRDYDTSRKDNISVTAMERGANL